MSSNGVDAVFDTALSILLTTQSLVQGVSFSRVGALSGYGFRIGNGIACTLQECFQQLVINWLLLSVMSLSKKTHPCKYCANYTVVVDLTVSSSTHGLLRILTVSWRMTMLWMRAT